MKKIYPTEKYKEAFRVWFNSLCGTDMGQDVLRGKSFMELESLFERCTGIVKKSNQA